MNIPFAFSCPLSSGFILSHASADSTSTIVAMTRQSPCSQRLGQPLRETSSAGNGAVRNTTKFGPVFHEFYCKLVMEMRSLKQGANLKITSLSAFVPKAEARSRQRRQLLVLVWPFGVITMDTDPTEYLPVRLGRIL